MAKYKILVLSGPNLNMLGKREVSVYGTKTLDGIHSGLHAIARELDAEVTCLQHNSEGELIDGIQRADEKYDGVIINPGAYAHYSYALRDAIEASPLPCVEAHITNIFGREEFRRQSVIAPVCAGFVAGFGSGSYSLALRAVVEYLSMSDISSS